jgi:hypothetical protein
MLVRGGHDMAFKVPDQPIIVVDQGQIDCDVLLHGWIGNAWGNPLTLRFGLEWVASRGHMALTVRLTNMGQRLCPLAHQTQAAPQPERSGITGGRRFTPPPACASRGLHPAWPERP